MRGLSGHDALDVQPCVFGWRNDAQILRPIVVLDAVDVMYALVRAQFAAQRLFHDEAVLRNVFLCRSSLIRGNPDEHVTAAFVDATAALPTCPAGTSARSTDRPTSTDAAAEPAPFAATGQEVLAAAFAHLREDLRSRVVNAPDVPPPSVRVLFMVSHMTSLSSLERNFQDSRSAIPGDRERARRDRLIRPEIDPAE